MIKLYYNSRGGRIPLHFSAADGGGSSGGGASNEAGKDGEIKTPFDNLLWDELDDKSRAELEKAKTDFVATLQSKSKLEADLKHERDRVSQFQSEADRLKAERDKQTRNDKPDPILDACYETLIATGYPEKEARALAAPFAEMHRKVGVIQKQEIGQDLMPMAQGVLANQATNAFQQAVQQDLLGGLKIPTVAEKVWQDVTAMVAKGQPVDVAIVANLGKMAFSDHMVAELRAGRTPALPTALPATPPMPGMNTGFSFPGAQIVPTFTPASEGNAAKYELNPETRAALAASFKSMTADMPKLMPDSLKTATPSRRNS